MDKYLNKSLQNERKDNKIIGENYIPIIEKINEIFPTGYPISTLDILEKLDVIKQFVHLAVKQEELSNSLNNVLELTKKEFKFTLTKSDYVPTQDKLVKFAYIGTPFPKHCDLTSMLPAVYNQLRLGSCAANSVLLNFKFKCPDKSFEPSRLYQYYEARAMKGNQDTDSGSTIADNVLSLQDRGVCSEHYFPYLIENFAVQPNKICDEDASKHKSKFAVVPQHLETIQGILMGSCIISFGMKIFESIYKVTRTNPVYNPVVSTETELGGHALTIVGYNTDTKLFKIRNSWGPLWGEDGNFYIPFSIILDKNICWDFFIIKSVVESPVNE